MPPAQANFYSDMRHECHSSACGSLLQVLAEASRLHVAGHHPIADLTRLCLLIQLPGMQETTMVNHAFSGYIRNQTLCQVCGQTSKVFESCMSLPLELPEGIHSLEDALGAYMRQESLDGDNQYRCDRCNKNVDAVRSCSFEVLPNTLQICLKRFKVIRRNHSTTSCHIIWWY